MRLVTVIDGDTYMAVDRRGRKRKLRLADHLDCPELDQRNGEAARKFVCELAERQLVRVQLRGRDRYRRHLARIRVGGQDLGLALVSAGLAYTQKKSSMRLRLAALRARAARRGVHRGFGQAKPWQARTRKSSFGYWFARKKRRTRKLKR